MISAVQRKTREPLQIHALKNDGDPRQRPTRHKARSRFVFGLRQTDRAATLFPLAALLHELDALKALENGTLATDGGSRFEAVVLGHKWAKVDVAGRQARGNRPCRQAINCLFCEQWLTCPDFPMLQTFSSSNARYL